jgi:hypothetical protein
LWLGGRLVPEGDLGDVVWPLALIAGGFAVLVMRAQPDDADVETPPARPDALDVADTLDVAETPDATDATGAPGAPDPAALATAPTSSAWPPSTPWRWPHPPRPSRPRRARSTAPRPERPPSYLTPLTISVVCCYAGVVALLAALDVVTVDLQVAGAIALAIIGGGLLLSAWFGRARGLVFLAVVLTAALAIVALVDTPIEGGIGDRDHRPTTRAALESEYRLAIGDMTLDLRAVPLPVGTTEVDATVAIGELVVYPPDDVTVEVHAETGIGEVSVFGEQDGGTSVERNDVVRDGARVLRLDLRTGIGRTHVPSPRATEVLR